jgi:transposase InsO family protein
MTDNAFAYTRSQAFRSAITDLGICRLTTRPSRPRVNGKAACFSHTALREWLYGKPYASSAERATDMPARLHWCNHHRPRHTCRNPASRLNNLLSNNNVAR